jgi:membrane associated rhomboid family serine protease
MASARARRLPWLTFSLLGAATALFAVENLRPARPPIAFLEPALTTLVAMGGVARPLVCDQGEWWRVLTAPMLHASPAHLFFNGIALLLGGLVLERLLGRAWLFVVFVLGAVGGSVASLIINDPSVVSVGASGAIMGLLAAALVTSFRQPEEDRVSIQMMLLRMLLPSLVPLATLRSGPHVDYAAHLGGAVTGVLVGLLLLRVWPRGDARPRFERAAIVLAAAGAALATFCFFRVERRWAAYARPTTGDPCLLSECIDETALGVCENGREIVMPCRGKEGCGVTRGLYECDVSEDREGDACYSGDEGNGQCSSDGEKLVTCRRGRIEWVPCRGPNRCVQKGYARCDRSLSAEGDSCAASGEGKAACAVDGKTVLFCRSGRFVRDLPCEGRCVSEDGRVVCSD